MSKLPTGPEVGDFPPQDKSKQGSITFALDNGNIIAKVDLPYDMDSNTENFRGTQFATMYTLIQRGQTEEYVDKAIIKAGILAKKEDLGYSISSKLEIMIYFIHQLIPILIRKQKERVNADEAFTRDFETNLKRTNVLF